MRTHGKGFEACFTEAKEKHGIRFVRCRVHSVFQSPDQNTQSLVYVDDDKTGLEKEEFDIVVLSVGMEIKAETKEFARKIGIDLTDGGFCKTQAFPRQPPAGTASMSAEPSRDPRIFPSPSSKPVPPPYRPGPALPKAGAASSKPCPNPRRRMSTMKFPGSGSLSAIAGSISAAW